MVGDRQSSGTTSGSDGMTYHGAWSVEQRSSSVLVRGDVVVPVLPLLEVAETELPALRRVVEARLEPLALLVLVDVQEELDDRRPLVRERLLERVDLVVALRPDLLGHEVVDADDQHVLVVRPVEDADLADRLGPGGGRATGSRGRAPPPTAP